MSSTPDISLRIRIIRLNREHIDQLAETLNDFGRLDVIRYINELEPNPYITANITDKEVMILKLMFEDISIVDFDPDKRAVAIFHW